MKSYLKLFSCFASFWLCLYLNWANTLNVCKSVLHPRTCINTPHTSPLSLSHTHAVWPLRPSRVLLRRLTTMAVFLQDCEACLLSWVGESRVTSANKRPHSHNLLRKQWFPHTHKHTHTCLVTPPLHRPCHNITQLIQWGEAACKAPAYCIKPLIQQLLGYILRLLVSHN